MVVTACSAAATALNEHERTGWPSIHTVHAPHWPTPQPYFTPTRFRLSRSTHSSGVDGSTPSSRCSLPLTFSVSIRVLHGDRERDHRIAVRTRQPAVEQLSRSEEIARNGEHRTRPLDRIGTGL